MKVITVSGLDKSGKHTQTELLKNRLIEEGYKVEKSDFHRYDQPTGELIMKWLKKEWNASQETIELIMAADKQNQQDWFKQLEKDGIEFLILDRYILDQIVYSSANGMDIKWVQTLQKHMRKSDLDIIVDIPAEVSMKRKGKHGENDRYESDLELLNRVRDNYIVLDEKYSAPLKYIVNGTGSIEDIHEDIYSIVIDNLT